MYLSCQCDKIRLQKGGPCLDVALSGLVQSVVQPPEDVLIVHPGRGLEGGPVEAHSLSPDTHHTQVVGHCRVQVASH